MTIKRYNSGIQRAKGFLELAAALYDSSLSSESWKAAEGALQTDSCLGNALRLSLTAKPNDRKGLSLSFATGSFREIKAVAAGKFSLRALGVTNRVESFSGTRSFLICEREVIPVDSCTAKPITS